MYILFLWIVPSIYTYMSRNIIQTLKGDSVICDNIDEIGGLWVYWNNTDTEEKYWMSS
jgi:hypothetical protein